MPGRSYSPNVSDIGFNGKREDNEIYGEGNALDFGARIYDSRLGRWMSTDPEQRKFPGISTYAFCYNSPIAFNDPTGESGRLTVNHGSKTITLEQTVFLYGKDVKPGSADAMNKSYVDAGPTTRTVKDEDGNEWTVTIKITYSDVNDAVIEKMTEGNGKPYSQTEDVDTKQIVGYQPGDYILKVDNSPSFEGGESGSTGGISGRNTTSKTKVHEPFHGFGYVDAPGAFVFLEPAENDTKSEADFTNGNHDVMQWGGSGVTGGWDIKNRHYTDLVDFVKKSIPDDVINKVMLKTDVISKPRGKLTEKEENKINLRVIKPAPKKSTPKPKF